MTEEQKVAWDACTERMHDMYGSRVREDEGMLLIEVNGGSDDDTGGSSAYAERALSGCFSRIVTIPDGQYTLFVGSTELGNNGPVAVVTVVNAA